MPTIDDLRRQLIDEVAAVPDSGHRADRVGHVHGRITARRRRRAAGAGVAVVALVAVTAAVLPQLAGPDRSAPPADPSPSVSGDVPLPEFQAGGRLLAQETHESAEAFAIPFTPTNDGALMFTVDCYVPGPGTATDEDPPMVGLNVDGTEVGSVGCGSVRAFTGGNTYTPDASKGQAGKASVLQVAIDRRVPETSRVRVGVYQRVPLAEYQFPVEPEPLPALEPVGNLDGSSHARPLQMFTADPSYPVNETSTTYADPNDTVTRTLTITKGLDIEAQTAAPGELTVKVGDRVVFSSSSWAYTQALSASTLSLRELGVSAGTPVRVTVISERFPGRSWALLLSDEAP